MSVHPATAEDDMVSPEGEPCDQNRNEDEEDEEIPASHYYEDRACQAFSKENWLRSATIKLYEHPLFDPLVLTIIFFNVVTLALYDPTDPDCETDRCKICLLYTSDAADDLLCVDLGGRRIIKKKQKREYNNSNTKK
eukprot:TRINITY_DN12680_c0_g1_i1.p1 TRINITY_DN12680_c0_g1~~TRINITY_DN12680_c0_g1_i1.p1  ORF type:complete len:137 (-),score=33.12 TRINITY_DN12680_c0_g1_i1:37-447(-)